MNCRNGTYNIRNKLSVSQKTNLETDLTAHEQQEEKERRGNRFIADPLVTGPIATNADYTRSGYDKGHMAPAADMKWSPEAMKESFYFSNMCPQHPQLNRRGWKNLEEKIRNWAIADSAIIIICGPIIVKPEQVRRVLCVMDAVRESEVGRRFKGLIWLQGQLHF